MERIKGVFRLAAIPFVFVYVVFYVVLLFLVCSGSCDDE